MPIKLLQLYKEPRKIYKTTKPYLDGIPLENHDQYWSDLYNEPKTYMAIDRWDMMGDWSDREINWREFEKIWVEDVIKEIQYAERHTGISLRSIESHKSIMRSEWHGIELGDIYFALNRYREKVLDNIYSLYLDKMLTPNWDRSFEELEVIIENLKIYRKARRCDTTHYYFSSNFNEPTYTENALWRIYQERQEEISEIIHKFEDKNLPISSDNPRMMTKTNCVKSQFATLSCHYRSNLDEDKNFLSNLRTYIYYNYNRLNEKEPRKFEEIEKKSKDIIKSFYQLQEYYETRINNLHKFLERKIDEGEECNKKKEERINELETKVKVYELKEEMKKMKSLLSNDEKLAELIINLEELSELVPKETVTWIDYSAKKERINWLKKKVDELEERFEELKEKELEEQFQNFYFGEEDEKIETSEIENLTIERQTKKSELEQLVNEKKPQLNEDLQEWLDNLLEVQEELIKSENQNKAFQKQLERAKKNLSKKLSEEEINSLLIKQAEIIKLEKKSEQLQSTQLKTQIVVPPK